MTGVSGMVTGGSDDGGRRGDNWWYISVMVNEKKNVQSKSMQVSYDASLIKSMIL